MAVGDDGRDGVVTSAINCTFFHYKINGVARILNSGSFVWKCMAVGLARSLLGRDSLWNSEFRELQTILTGILDLGRFAWKYLSFVLAGD